MRTVIGKIVGLQALVTAASMVVAFCAGGWVAAWSAGLGGAIGFIPSAAYGFLLLRKQFGSPRGLLQRHYVGESGKLVLTV